MIFFRIAYIFLLLTAVSCKKEHVAEKPVKTELPNFGNVDLDNIFKRKDRKLENKDSITTVIENYYKNIWEKGDLWGGFLVAKGDEILFENYRGFAQDGRGFRRRVGQDHVGLGAHQLGRHLGARAGVGMA